MPDERSSASHSGAKPKQPVRLLTDVIFVTLVGILIDLPTRPLLLLPPLRDAMS